MTPPQPPLGATPEPSLLDKMKITLGKFVCDHMERNGLHVMLVEEYNELSTARAALAQCEEKCEELSEMVETADADAAKHYEDIHKESMAAVEAIRTAEGWGDGVFASVRDRIWWIAATRTIDALRASRRDEESWWKEKHDYQARAESAESKLAQCEDRLAEMTARATSLSLHLPPETLCGDVQKWRDEALALTAAHAKALEDGKRLEAATKLMTTYQRLSPSYCMIPARLVDEFLESAVSAPATTGKGGEIS